MTDSGYSLYADDASDADSLNNDGTKTISLDIGSSIILSDGSQLIHLDDGSIVQIVNPDLAADTTTTIMSNEAMDESDDENLATVESADTISPTSRMDTRPFIRRNGRTASKDNHQIIVQSTESLLSKNQIRLVETSAIDNSSTQFNNSPSTLQMNIKSNDHSVQSVVAAHPLNEGQNTENAVISYSNDALPPGRDRFILPSFVDVTIRQPDARLSVVARERIRASTDLGKLTAPRTSHQFTAQDVFLLKTIQNGRATFLDMSDESVCNWLCMINTAKSLQEINCLALQIEMNIHYVSVRDVEVGEELKVWYDDNYARSVNLPLTPNPNVHNMRTARNRFASSSDFLHYLLGDRASVKEGHCGKCKEFCSDLSRHVCSLLVSGTCPVCRVVCASLPDHMCAKVKLTQIVQDTIGIRPAPKKTYNRVYDPEWTPTRQWTARRGRGRGDVALKRGHGDDAPKRGRGRPRKYPIQETIPTPVNGVHKRPRGRPRKNLSYTSPRPAAELFSCSNSNCNFLCNNETELSDHVSHCSRLKTATSVIQDLPRVLEVVEEENGVVKIVTKPENVENQNAEDVQVREIHVEIVQDPDVEKNLVEDVPQSVQCGVCEKRFDDEATMVSHSVRHNTESYCTVCDLFFTDLNLFTNHVCESRPASNSGLTTSLVQCEKCPDVFSNTDDFEGHLERNHPAPETEKSNLEENTDPPDIVDHTPPNNDEHDTNDIGEERNDQVTIFCEKYECELCSRTFKRVQQLLTHLALCNRPQLKNYSCFHCDFCTQVFASRKYLNLHLQTHNKYSNCSVCKKQFSSEESLSKHECGLVNEFEGGLIELDKIFCCGECSKKFKTQQHLNLHLTKHSGRYKCEQCATAFGKASELDKHSILCRAKGMIEVHSKIQCDSCDSEFTDADAFQKHVLSHRAPFECRFCLKPYYYISALESHQNTCNLNQNKESGPVSCSHCAREFMNQVSLKRHMVFHETPKFECAYCKNKFHRKDYYQSHMCQREDGSSVRMSSLMPKSSPDKDISCPTCHRHFSSTSNRNKHMLLHKEKSHVCDICDRRFHLIHSLKHHKRYVHSKELEAQCPLCKKRLKNRSSLRAHFRFVHHGDKRRWACPVCSRLFNQRGNMLKHMLKHSDKKTFHCQFCPATFKYPDQFGRHMTEHRDGKRFLCGECNKSFLKEYDLKSHLTTYHTGRLFSCEFCSFESRFENAMRRHVHRKHMDKVPRCTSAYLQTLVKAGVYGKVQLETVTLPVVEDCEQIRTDVAETEMDMLQDAEDDQTEFVTIGDVHDAEENDLLSGCENYVTELDADVLQ